MTTLEALAPAARAGAVAAFAEGKIPATAQSLAQLSCVDDGLLGLLREEEDEASYAGAKVSWAPQV